MDNKNLRIYIHKDSSTNYTKRLEAADDDAIIDELLLLKNALASRLKDARDPLSLKILATWLKVVMHLFIGSFFPS